MDYVTRQFINLTKKLRKDLRQALTTLHTDVQKLSETIQENNDADSQRQSTPPILRAELQIPPTPIACSEAPDAKKDRREHIKIGLEVLTLLGVFGYASIAYLQWREMIGATGAAQQAVVEARRNRLQAEKSLRATIEQFRLDQRAWLDIGDILKPNVILGSTPTWVIPIVNTGKTPAFHVWHVVTGRSYPKGEKFKAVYTKFDKDRTFVAILPGPPTHSTYTKTAHPITTTDIEHLGSGKDIFYIYGQMTYDDVFKQPHHTHFCFYLTINLKDLAACDTYNDAD